MTEPKQRMKELVEEITKLQAEILELTDQTGKLIDQHKKAYFEYVEVSNTKPRKPWEV
jgi:hypothetical protein